MKLPTITHRDAYISDDGVYRYWLTRRWNNTPHNASLIVWCMLNPSTADASVDDPTIKRCVGFSNAWGFGRLVVVNLYAFRATNPRDLESLSPIEREGPENNTWLRLYLHAANARAIVCAWGGNRIKAITLPPAVVSAPLKWCLGRTASGEPKHPLYLSADTPLQVYNP